MLAPSTVQRQVWDVARRLAAGGHLDHAYAVRTTRAAANREVMGAGSIDDPPVWLIIVTGDFPAPAQSHPMGATELARVQQEESIVAADGFGPLDGGFGPLMNPPVPTDLRPIATVTSL